jgi:hypothetical protein
VQWVGPECFNLGHQFVWLAPRRSYHALMTRLFQAKYLRTVLSNQ